MMAIRSRFFVFRPEDHKAKTMRHTKDPHKHALAMMPANARKKDKTK